MPVGPTLRVAAFVASSVAALAGTARAVPLDVLVVVENEDDLLDLQLQGLIDDRTRDAMIELFRRGVDLNRASREELYSLPNLTLDEVDGILRYRGEAGRIGDPADLVAAGILEAERLFAIAAFFVIRDYAAAAFETRGRVTTEGLWVPADGTAPAATLGARVETLRYLRAGVAVVPTRRRLDDVRYDPNRDTLLAGAPSAQVHVPKLYLLFETSQTALLGGTYQIGFGERLTFDTTDEYTPHGFVPDDQVYVGTDLVRGCIESAGELPASPCPSGAAPGDVVEYVAPDYRWREGLLGAAASLKKLELGTGWLSGTGFASFQSHSIYQYEIYDRRTCADPEDDADPGCAAPYVYRDEDDPLLATSRFSFMTLPDMFRETLVGGNVTYHGSSRARLGVTAYRSDVTWLVDGMELDFQEWSRWPRGGPFGAAGVAGAWGRGSLDFAAELSRSFDSMGGAGGDTGGLMRATLSDKTSELETLLRWYGEDYVNPYAAPVAQPDETQGQRARDEVGARVRGSTVYRRRLSLRGLLDVWVTPSTQTQKLLLSLRSDVAITDQVSTGLWVSFHDKDLEAGGTCYEYPTEVDIEGELVPCSGRRTQLSGRVRVAPRSDLWFTAQYQHGFLDDPAYPDSQRQDLSAWLTFTWKPAAAVRLRGRTRYLSEDLQDPENLEESLWSYLALDYRYERSFYLRTRYDLYVWLDERTRTMARSPSPEHWLRLEAEARF